MFETLVSEASNPPSRRARDRNSCGSSHVLNQSNSWCHFSTLELLQDVLRPSHPTFKFTFCNLKKNMDVKSFIFFSVFPIISKNSFEEKTQVFAASLPNVGVFTGAKKPHQNRRSDLRDWDGSLNFCCQVLGSRVFQCRGWTCRAFVPNGDRPKSYIEIHFIGSFFLYVGDTMRTFWGSLTRNPLRISWGPSNGRVNESVCLGQDT